MLNLKRALLLAPLLAAFMTLTAPTASATSYVLNIDGTGQLGPGPYGTVNVTDNGANTVHLTVTINPLWFVLTGNSTAASTIGFNIVGANLPLTLSNAPSGWTLQQGAVYGGNNFGNFEYSIDCCSGNNGGSNAQNISPAQFDLTGTGLTAASFAQLSTGGNVAAFFSVDIFRPATPGADNAVTGTIGSTIVSTPEPSTLLTLGCAVLCLGFATRRFNRLRLER